MSSCLDTLPVDTLAEFESELYDYIERTDASIFETLREKQAIDDALEGKMKAAITAFTEEFKSTKGLK